MSKYTAIAILFIMLVTLSCGFAVTAGATQTEGEAEVVLRFAAIADAHFSPVKKDVPKHFEKVMNTFYGIASEDKSHSTVDALVFVGDFVNTYAREDYSMLKQALSANVKSETRVLACLGNHEYFAKENGSGLVDTSVAAQYMKDYLGIDSIDTSTEINGFRFILNSLRYEKDKGRGWTDKENLEWLEQELSSAAAADPEKPIFTFAHISVKDTVATAMHNHSLHNGGLGSQYDIYKNYPQIINFSGHDHYILNCENAIHQRDFTSVIAGSLITGGAGKDESIWADTAQCLLVEVDANNTVTIKRYDVLNNTFIGEDWVIRDPSDKSGFVYTDERAEKYKSFEFDDGQEITVSNVRKTSIRVAFDAVENNPNVIYYRLGVYQGSEKVAETVIGSEIWKKKPSKTFKYNAQKLKEDTEYTFKLVAVDSFDNESVPLTLTVRTLNANGEQTTVTKEAVTNTVTNTAVPEITTTAEPQGIDDVTTCIIIAAIITVCAATVAVAVIKMKK